MQTEMQAILEDLREFVRKITQDRDQSHGYEHMVRVSEISHDLWYMEEKRGKGRTMPPLLLVMAAALLHDVADHKYDIDGSMWDLVLAFIRDNPHLRPFETALTWIIENISWSKERKANGENLTEYAGTMIGYARDILSDADKSCALGLEGYHRTKEYAEKHLGIDDPEKVMEHIRDHSNEKLLRLLPEGYFRTESGRELAQKLHDELVSLVTV